MYSKLHCKIYKSNFYSPILFLITSDVIFFPFNPKYWAFILTAPVVNSKSKLVETNASPFGVKPILPVAWTFSIAILRDFEKNN